MSLWDGLLEPPDRRAAAEIARAVNAAICELEDRLDRWVRGEHRVGFLCECGCLSIAAITMTAYRAAGGAWIAGHAEGGSSASEIGA